MVRLTISYHAFANQFRRYYGSVGPIYSFFNLSIDGSKPQRLNAKSNLYLDQQLIWSNNSLGPGRHTITLTHDDTDPGMELLSVSYLWGGKGETSDSPYLPLFSSVVVRCPRHGRHVYAPLVLLNPRDLECYQRMHHQSVPPTKIERTMSH